mgnify:FL=1
MLSNGAFKLTDYQPAATAFTLEKNPDYYDAGKIALDGLAYQVIKDSQQALMSYQTGALDMTLLNGEQVDQVKDDPSLPAWVPVTCGTSAQYRQCAGAGQREPAQGHHLCTGS